MTDAQLYLSVGIPTLAVIVSLIVNLARHNATNRRIDDLRDSINRRVDDLRDSTNKRFEDLTDLIKSEIKRVDEHVGRLDHPIVRQ